MVHASRRDPDGRGFLASVATTMAEPLSKIARQMTREELLRAVTGVIHAALAVGGEAEREIRRALSARLDAAAARFRADSVAEPHGLGVRPKRRILQSLDSH